MKGHPVVALTDRGNHFVVISGYERGIQEWLSKFFVVDYPARGGRPGSRWLTLEQLGFHFDELDGVTWVTGGRKTRTIISMSGQRTDLRATLDTRDPAQVFGNDPYCPEPSAPAPDLKTEWSQTRCEWVCPGGPQVCGSNPGDYWDSDSCKCRTF